MNYLPYGGYWFYGAASKAQRASFFTSWGLLAIAPAGALQYPMRFFKALSASNLTFSAEKGMIFRASKKMTFKAKQ
jgi:hypothetical protein